MTERADGDLQDRHSAKYSACSHCCMLRLQQCERLVKAIVAHHDLTWMVCAHHATVS